VSFKTLLGGRLMAEKSLVNGWWYWKMAEEWR
jgi:hypothetical protein